MELIKGKTALFDSEILCEAEDAQYSALAARFGEATREGTMAASVLAAHNASDDGALLRVKFDALTSHDITYVGIIQTARASGLSEFPVKYILTNCHNSLCAVGGTINEDDHAFGLSAAQKFGGEFVPPHLAVIHSYMRECEAAPGRMLLGSDSHTRYGAFGTLGVGEGGPELAKQLLGRTWDITPPEVICVYLKGAPRHGVGPQDVALAIIGATYEQGFVKNKIMEFVGEGVKNLSMEFRSGIDVMTTETTCLSSIWVTDETTKAFMTTLGRGHEYREMKPAPAALYDGAIVIDLDRIEPMIALPMHPSNTYTIREFSANTADILRLTEVRAKESLGDKVESLGLLDKLVGGKFYVDQAIVAGCAGGSFENLAVCANILDGCDANNLSASFYPGSMPIALDLARKGVSARLMQSGIVLKTAFCGPCFGAGDTPQNRGFSIRHTTRNFPMREGAKPGEGQISSVALMDARSIAATVRAGGVLTAADTLDYSDEIPAFDFDPVVYEKKVYRGWGNPKPETELVIGPNITDWPDQPQLSKHLLVKIASVIEDEVTTTDELIPSGESSSLRSNPEKLSRLALSRRDPNYVPRALEVRAAERDRQSGVCPLGRLPELEGLYEKVQELVPDLDPKATVLGSAIFANCPGDGSAREQAASCQKVLGGQANFARSYATKRYRSNLINWGMLPMVVDDNHFSVGDWVLFSDVRAAVAEKKDEIAYTVLRKDGENWKSEAHVGTLGVLSEEERAILLDGCLINFYKN